MKSVFHQNEFSREDLIYMLTLNPGDELQYLFQTARDVRNETVGNFIYLRGLIEISNMCTKNCLYCGIRAANTRVDRYEMDEDEILEIVKFAERKKFGSVVFQSGERSDKAFVNKIDSLVQRVMKETEGKVRITLSCGEQSEETYRRWFESGVRRYLLRIESSNEKIFKRIHPADSSHDFRRRMDSLASLKKAGFQVGTGVMIGLPGQTEEDLADDLLFFKAMDIDMVGMGPYIEHQDTPMAHSTEKYLSLSDRLALSLKMIAVLRLFMKNINIATATALQAIHPDGREMGIRAGANVFMPNITPGKYCENYRLYENKPMVGNEESVLDARLEKLEKLSGSPIAWSQHGDSLHWNQ